MTEYIGLLSDIPTARKRAQVLGGRRLVTTVGLTAAALTVACSSSSTASPTDEVDAATTDSGPTSNDAVISPPDDAPPGLLDAVEFADWGVLLEAYAGEGCFDYRALTGNVAATERLQRAVAVFRVTDPGALSTNDERLAWWINAYNVLMVSLVVENLEHYQRETVLAPPPDGPTFTERRFDVAGTLLSLDDIEHGVLRRDTARLVEGSEESLISTLETHAADVYGDSPFDVRIHFAVNCASAGCPELREEPYSGSRISEQLEAQTVAFLRDPDKGAGPGGVSDLIKLYYPDDFDRLGGWEQYVRSYNADADTSRSLGYNWDLNQCR